MFLRNSEWRGGVIFDIPKLMNDLYSQWKKDEKANFEGWDFSFLKDRWFEEQPPWNYEDEAKNRP